MTAAEIRERFLSFFEARGHLRVPSSSLVPASYDPSVLLTTAGMQQFKPYFRGEEEPPSRRLTSCQKVFRTVDIEVVGTTARHLTFFEMLGNFSVGDYFKQGASELAWEFSTAGPRARPRADLDHRVRRGRGARPRPRRGGDRMLARDRHPGGAHRPPGPRGQLLAVRARRARAARAPSSTSTAAPTSEPDSERPGDDTERYLEYWNLVFMQYELHSDGSLTELPQQNIDTGLGLDRMAAIQQDVPSVYETEHFRPLVEFGEQRSGRALRPGRADHAVPARAGRPRPRRRLPDGRRRGALQRGARLRAAPHPASRHPPRPHARHRGALRARSLRGGGGDRWATCTRAASRARDDRALGRGRGGGLRPHAEPGRAAAGGADRARPGERRRTRWPPRTRFACTTPTASRSR